MNNTIGNKTFQLVWSNFDICHEIASYCNPTDLLTFEIINSICYKVLDLVITIHKSIHIQYIQAGQVVFSEFRHSSYYKYLIYRQSFKSITQEFTIIDTLYNKAFIQIY